jgi:hypothetical protein
MVSLRRCCDKCVHFIVCFHISILEVRRFLIAILIFAWSLLIVCSIALSVVDGKFCCHILLRYVDYLALASN